MPQRAIRFPDDLHDAIVAKVAQLGRPHTFSSFVVNAADAALREDCEGGHYFAVGTLHCPRCGVPYEGPSQDLLPTPNQEKALAEAQTAARSAYRAGDGSKHHPKCGCPICKQAAH
jgi:hypothetical protein